MRVTEVPGYVADPDQRPVAHDDEKCFAVLEVDLRTEDDKIHRFQLIDFLRGNTRMREFRDLNKLQLWSVLDYGTPYRQWSLLEHTVGECKMIADEARMRNKARAAEVAQRRAESTLIQDAITRAEITQKVLRRQTQFGPGKLSGTQRS
ncbi:MAG: hypothetical protein LC118_05885 [Dehalococcoidia bacterium]|nr:hypothetical protein [Dehalococcoidia bacterium]